MSLRTASRALSSCSAVVPESSGRSSALPPKATTASGRTKEKNGVGFIVGEKPSGLQVLPNEGHRHAARSAAGPRELVRGQQNRVLLAGLPELELFPAEQEIGLVHDAVSGAVQLGGGGFVAVVEEDDARRQREG